MGHAERGKKLNMAFGMLDHSAGIAKAAGAEVVVFHPGFLLGRTREDAIDAVVEQLGELRERLEKKDRVVPFGVEVMGRVRDLGSIDDVVRDRIARSTSCGRCSTSRTCTRPPTARTSTTEPFAEALAKADAVMTPERRSTSTSPTSSTRTATRQSISPTARGRSAPSRCARRSRGSTGRRR